MARQEDLKKNAKYPFIRRALKKRYDKAALAAVLCRAEAHYADLAARCAGATPGEWLHLNNTILPTAAVYKALLETDSENALAVTRDALLSDVWGYDYAGDTNVVDVYIRYLRHKIDEPFGVKTIQTIRAVGYKFQYE